MVLEICSEDKAWNFNQSIDGWIEWLPCRLFLIFFQHPQGVCNNMFKLIHLCCNNISYSCQNHTIYCFKLINEDFLEVNLYLNYILSIFFYLTSVLSSVLADRKPSRYSALHCKNKNLQLQLARENVLLSRRLKCCY